ncbi:hypothetical protein ACFQ1E_14990 [Sphingomonas canadensis]|uniref:DUF2178 domain-containing protein n=1 Tax=Sphingomonas canadensis TaxID=1219257 RepID=A0ABW3H9D8_9SPHN|nr:hypothetical protein [Sphingomonas canadensis]MCW3837492.1 hypothetical protein [Sphingomonas canadensis]
MNTNDLAEAEMLGRRRARMWPALSAIFLFQQMVFFAHPDAGQPQRMVEWVRVSAWLMLTLVLIAALWSGGYWVKRRAVRALMNDEVTRANRADALALGFLLAMLAAVALYVAAMFEPVPVRAALHVVLSTGIASALIRFGLLERRAYRDA